MRRAAGEGLAGIQSADPATPDMFMFMVRVEEAGSDLPTVLATCCGGDVGDCLTRSVVKPLSHAELLHWQRYDILDRLTARWGVKCPFRAWNHGDPLYELATDGIVVLIADVPLMGDWNLRTAPLPSLLQRKPLLIIMHTDWATGRTLMMTTESLSPMILPI